MQLKSFAAESLLFISSDFLRAKQTAEVCMEASGLDPQHMLYRNELRERWSKDIIMFLLSHLQSFAPYGRYFGWYDSKELLYYNRVWPIDTVRIVFVLP